jgi:hypothetical protein
MKEFLHWLFTLSFKEDGFQLSWNTLPSKYGYLGFKKEFYDGPMFCFGFYFWHVVITPGAFPSMMETYDLRDALLDAVEINPEVHLLSNNKTVREYAITILEERINNAQTQLEDLKKNR